MWVLRQRWVRIAPATAIGIAILAVGGFAFGQASNQSRGSKELAPAAEFQMARMIYGTNARAGSRGYSNPVWMIDWPYDEQNFLPALSRMTNLEVAGESRSVAITDDEVFDYPWLLIQQVGLGYWRPSPHEAERLREYLLRGGFLVVDDFHGQAEWATFVSAIQRVFPDRPIVDINEEDTLLNVLFDLDQRTQIPGERHLRGGSEGPAYWGGIYDDDGRLMVAINHNIDMGDAWEHADDPGYPLPMTALSYRFGVNYVIYAMTH